MAKSFTAQQQNRLAEKNVVVAQGVQKILSFLGKAEGSKVTSDTVSVMNTGSFKGLF